MTARPQTIQIYLPGGDPRGIRVAVVISVVVQTITIAALKVG